MHRLWAATPDAVRTYTRQRVERMANGAKPPAEMEEGVEFHNIHGIAVIEIGGILLPEDDMWCWERCSAYPDIRDELFNAIEGGATAIIAKIASPGGTVNQLPETMAYIEQLRADNPRVPMFAVVEQYACSAAMALAACFEQVFVSPSAQLGSLGVVAERFDYSEHNKQRGLAINYETVGDAKLDGYVDAPYTEAERARLRADVRATAERFYADVARVRPALADGGRSLQAQIYTGADAVEVGLADDVATLEQVLIALTGG